MRNDREETNGGGRAAGTFGVFRCTCVGGNRVRRVTWRVSVFPGRRQRHGVPRTASGRRLGHRRLVRADAPWRTAIWPPAARDTMPTRSIKAGVIATVFWGVVGFFVGVLIAWQLAFPALNLRPALDQLRPPAPGPHLGGDLRLRRQRADRHLVLRGAADLPGAARRPLGALVRVLGLPAVHRASPPPAT